MDVSAGMSPGHLDLSLSFFPSYSTPGTAVLGPGFTENFSSLSSPLSPPHRPRWAEQLFPFQGATVLEPMPYTYNREYRGTCNLPEATDCHLVGRVQVWSRPDLDSGLSFVPSLLYDPG